MSATLVFTSSATGTGSPQSLAVRAIERVHAASVHLDTTGPVFVVCRSCGIEREAGIGCGLPCA